MTLAEQAIEALITHGPSVGPALGALLFAVRAWINSRAAKNLSSARVEESVAETLKDMRARDKARDADMRAMRRELAECHAAREEQREVIASLEIGTAELRREIEEMRRTLASWVHDLTEAGIPAEDSGERAEALTRMRLAAEAWSQDRAWAAGIEEQDGRVRGEEG